MRVDRVWHDLVIRRVGGLEVKTDDGKGTGNVIRRVGGLEVPSQ